MASAWEDEVAEFFHASRAARKRPKFGAGKIGWILACKVIDADPGEAHEPVFAERGKRLYPSPPCE